MFALGNAVLPAVGHWSETELTVVHILYFFHSRNPAGVNRIANHFRSLFSLSEIIKHQSGEKCHTLLCISQLFRIIAV